MKAVSAYILISLSVPVTAWSQSIYNSTSIFIPSTVSIHTGDVNNTGFIQNNGTIELTGDWKNQKVYQGLGTVALSGSNQTIDNNDQPVQNLTIDGGGAKSLEGKLTITSSIEFFNGIMHVGERDTLLVRDHAKIEGGSSSSFVEGAMTIEGTGYRFFPVGRNGFYYPFILTDIRGVKTITQVAAFKDVPGLRTTGVVTIDPSVYWTLHPVSGSFDGSPVSAPHHFEKADPELIVFVAGNDFDEEFTIIDNDGVESDGSMSFVLSKEPVTQSIIALGETPEKPVIPGYLSTSMSPNASNANNRLVKFFGPDVRTENFHIQIFNRWGNSIFESRSFNEMTTQGWDGKNNGQLLPAGAYPYRLAYVDRRGKEQTQTGFITIIY